MPGDAGRPRSLDGARQEPSGGGLNHAQGAHFRATRRSAVSHILAIVRRMPPVQRDGPVRSQLVGIHQDAIFTVYPFSHVKYGLVLHAFTTSIEVVLAADLRRANVANGQQLFQALVNLVTSRQRVEKLASVS